MREFDKPISGSIALERIEFKRVLCRKVIKLNDRGGKVSVPKELIGKYVYIVIP
jgi:putative transposon-encoded protein